MSWGLIAIMGLKSDQAVDNELNNTFRQMIPEIQLISKNTALTALDVESLKEQVSEVKNVQKGFREQLIEVKIDTGTTLSKVESIESSRITSLQEIERDLNDLEKNVKDIKIEMER